MVKLTLSFKGKILKVFHPISDQVLIGRGPDCDIQIDNLGVSPMHARIKLSADEASLSDISGEGGVQVNGKQVNESPLQHGDEIVIGKHTLTFTLEAGAVAEAPAASSFMPQRGGWLQFMNGPKLGRTIRLDRNLIRLGKVGKESAMIASRGDGYYVSHLEGDTPTLVAGSPVGEESRKLNNGDTVQVGDIKMLFFLDEA